MFNRLFLSNSSLYKRLFSQFCSLICGISQECIALLETMDFVLELVKLSDVKWGWVEKAVTSLFLLISLFRSPSWSVKQLII